MCDATACGANVSRTTAGGSTGGTCCRWRRRSRRRRVDGGADDDDDEALCRRAAIQRVMSRDVEHSDTADDIDDMPRLYMHTARSRFDVALDSTRNKIIFGDSLRSHELSAGTEKAPQFVVNSVDQSVSLSFMHEQRNELQKKQITNGMKATL